MFTKNYKMYRNMMFKNDTYVHMTNIEGSSSDGCYAQYSYAGDFGASMGSGQCRTPASGYPGIYFGRGTTPPTENDYKLEETITAGLSITNSGMVSRNKGNGVYEMSSAFIVRNTGTEDITIAEMGYVAKCGYASSKSHAYLMERQVLDAPIVIAPGERKLITYTITFNQTA